MTAVTVSALALAGAAVIPPAPYHRLAAASPRRVPRRVPRRLRLAAAVAGAASAVTGVAAVVPVSVVFALAVLTGAVGLQWRATRRERRDRAARRTLNAALDVLIGELRVGADPVAGLLAAADDAEPGAVRQGLRSVAGGARLGADVPGALRRLPSVPALVPYWERMAICWQVAHEHGVRIAPLLQAAHRDLAARQRHVGHLRAALAGTRATAAILAVLPLIGVLLGELIGAQPLRFLLGGGGGGAVLVAGVCLILLGVAWSQRIVAGVLS